MKAGQPDHGALLLMALTVSLWGFSWIVMKTMVPIIGPFDLVMSRYLLAFVVLLVILLATRQSLALPPLGLMIGTAVFQTAAFQCLCQLALVTGGAGHVVMLAYTMPFWMALFAWVILGEKPARRHVVGFILAGIGLVGIIAPWQGLGSLAGSLLALAGGMSWGLGAVLAKRMFQQQALNVLTVTMWQMLFGALLTWPVTQIFAQPSIVWGWELVWGLAYMGIGASALGWWLWLSVVRRVSASVAGMSSLGVPVLTVILAWLLLGEQPTGAEIAGIVCILAGLVIVTRPGGRRAPAANNRRKGAA